ncbi:MAG TPA: DALR domain-containing protein, partial [Terriglobia bacterium]|nr:DALR domain-containing protein [Terriglobia bacterium]
KFPAGENKELQAKAEAARRAFEEALDDNLNTAEGLAALFDLVRDGNTAMDRGKFRDGDRGAFLDTMERWDRVFAVLDDNDRAKLRRFGFVKSGEEREARAAAVVGNGYTSTVLVEALNDEEIEKHISERNAARRSRDFARADKIRDELLDAGVILEDTKAGTRWKRK